jgi:GH35 family endo-1,4-beta-xylanase
LAREFDMVEPEDAMKWWTVRRNPGRFDPRAGDAVVYFAPADAMKVRGHCLVSQGHFTPIQWSHLPEEHIPKAMKHYAGQVFAWAVVNEATEKRRMKTAG